MKIFEDILMFRHQSYIYLLAFMVLFVAQNKAFSCDHCAIYSSVESQKTEQGSLRLSLAEQYSIFDKIQDSGKFVENVAGQKLSSSITQVAASYDLTDKISLQLNAPLINRRFKRIENDAIKEGSESGLGDMTLIAKYDLFRSKEMDATIDFEVFAGLKLPTGNSDRLKEELEEAEIHEDSLVFRHADHEHEGEGGIANAIHGHDLALGSGSVDIPVGFSFFYQKQKALVFASAQYMFRNSGDHSYEYADDFNWRIEPAYYLMSEHDRTMTLGLGLSGEYKREDKGADGESFGDTAVRSIYWGPQFRFIGSRNVSGEIGLDIPIDINNSERQVVAAYRLRMGLTYRF